MVRPGIPNALLLLLLLLLLFATAAGAFSVASLSFESRTSRKEFLPALSSPRLHSRHRSPLFRKDRYFVAWDLFSQSDHRADPDDSSRDSKDPIQIRADPKETTTTATPPEPFDLDTFLDTPFFDPDQIANDETSPPILRKFAQFVQNDYPTAEAILTGIFLAMLILVGQELVRMQIYGENYVPFTKGVQPGSLF
jgi:hypothetical protein